ncbi:MAG: DUF3987 domain-containing protein [Candidatus Hydrogenedentes bacterium]|nr:DUF3987 domain-containing protein [Candidatus Hydrogenedentota bacterium]
MLTNAEKPPRVGMPPTSGDTLPILDAAHPAEDMTNRKKIEQDGKTIPEAAPSGSAPDVKVFGIETAGPAAAKQTANDKSEIKNYYAELSPIDGALPPATEFPREILGPKFLETAFALQTLSGGAPFELGAMALFGAINYAVQGLLDVGVHVNPSPINTYILVVGASGERKSTTMCLAKKPISDYHEAQRRLQRRILDELALRNVTLSKEAMAPTVSIVDEASTAALRDLLSSRTYYGTLGLFLDEAGMMLGGGNMTGNRRIEMQTLLSKMHDGGVIVLNRSGKEPIEIANKRFSMTLMGQWRPVSGFLGDQTCQSQGLLSRLLIAYPDSTIGRRKDPSESELAEARKVYDRYRGWMSEVLDCLPHLVPGTYDELNPPVMTLSPDARKIMQDFSAEMEAYYVKIGLDNPVIDHVNKMPDLAVRVAATMQIFEQGGAGTLGAGHADVAWELDGNHMAMGLELMRFFIKEKERLIAPAPDSQQRDDAKLLLSWMRENDRVSFVRSDVYAGSRKGRLRDKKTLDGAIALLKEYGWLTEGQLTKGQGAARLGLGSKAGIKKAAKTQDNATVRPRAKRLYSLTDAAVEQLKRNIDIAA